jgi:hypothetical protein
VLSPFLSKPRPESAGARVALRLTAAAVVLASLAAGVAALASDLRVAFRDAGPSVFSDDDRRQMIVVRQALRPGDALLLVATPADVWQARVWQRALYPRNPVVVLLGPYDPVTVGRIRDRHGIRRAVVLGEPPPITGFQPIRDLGVAGSAGRASFGELTP